jgi:cardiolipin synthase
MLYLTILGGGFLAWFVLVILFAPGIPYHVDAADDAASEAFVHALEASCGTTLEGGNRVDVLTNGPVFYPAMLEAIRHAGETINMECYIFHKGETADRFIEALTERARAGVKVTMVFDMVGSFGSFRSCAGRLEAAGCRVGRYQPFTWYGLARLNNRTHRELLVVDGRVAFVGGAGVADWWAKPLHGKATWRDMMSRIEGPVVSRIQGIFAENWLECCGEVLLGPQTYKSQPAVGRTPAFAIKSSPSDRSTVSRVLFQALIAGARHTLRVSTPYFLPDKHLRRALIGAVQRGVAVSILVPGSVTDQKWLRLASRRSYGKLLRGGVRIFEYQPGMTHVKTMLVDDLWAVIGSTNLDNRSFEHNDEANVAIRDPDVAARYTEDFVRDLAASREILLKDWDRRSIIEKLVGSVAWILERQQ